ncbi:hypothetical protein BX070DRAFT_219666 [Coemansia spiralis]|nr:hypothetical protein BX070DRAFT_219666 [Coemansia spiralis]
MVSLAELDIEELQKLKRKQLQSLCKKHGIKANGKNEELIEHLLEAATNGGNSNKGNMDNGISDIEDNEGMKADGDDIAGPGTKQDKMFKVLPESCADQPAIETPESMSFVDNKLFVSLAEKVTAEMEARAAALASSERKAVVAKYEVAHNVVLEAPNKPKSLGKVTAFDKAHDKIFNNDDSIANHWSAKKAPGTETPKGKRANGDTNTLESSKRPRIEPLFTSPLVTKSIRQKKQMEQTKAATSKAKRMGFARTTASASGSKTALADSRVKPIDACELSSTVLFAGEKTATDTAAFEELIPIPGEGTSDKAEILAPAAEPINAQIINEEPVDSEETSQEEEQLVQDQETEQPAAEIEDHSVSEPTKTQTEATSTDSKSNPSSDTTGKSKIAALSNIAIGTKLAAINRPSLIPSSKSICNNKPVLSAKAPVSKPTLIPNGRTKISRLNTAKQDAAQRPKQPASYRNVESKVKAYIDAKLPEPKVKSVKQVAISANSKSKPTSAIGKPLITMGNKQANTLLRKKDTGLKNGKDDDQKTVPSYMKSTRATEIRAQKADEKGSVKQPLAKSGKSDNINNCLAKARYNPYSRVAKPVTTKPSITK